ncbi:MAG: thioredoxin family protein [Dehalococcoidia bacterium]|nr:thioredoxin family protein [Dehalococcoidia bacterium]
MTTGQSVVTPERFAQGLLYKDYMANVVKVNKDRFERYYQTAQQQMTPADVEFFKKAVHAPGGPAKVLVIGEDWCPDVYRGMPTIAAVADASGMDMKVFPRDSHLDIMNEFLNQGQFQSVPTVVFYTKDYSYIMHWIERPESVTKEMEEIRAKVAAEMAGKPEQEIRGESSKRNTELFPHYQRLTIDDWKQIFRKYVR